MDLNRKPIRENKILKKYSGNIWAEWIPSTYVDEKGLVQEQEEWSEHIPGSGRWGVFTRGLRTQKPYLIYIADTPYHNYRDINYDIDMKILYNSDRAKRKEFMNTDNYRQYKELRENNRIKKEKEDRRFSEEAKEKARDMWGYVTGRPYITGGIDFNNN